MWSHESGPARDAASASEGGESLLEIKGGKAKLKKLGREECLYRLKVCVAIIVIVRPAKKGQAVVAPSPGKCMFISEGSLD